MSEENKEEASIANETHRSVNVNFTEVECKLLLGVLNLAVKSVGLEVPDVAEVAIQMRNKMVNAFNPK